MHHGRRLTPMEALNLGVVKLDSGSETPKDWGIQSHEVPLGPNIMVDGGRQFLAYLYGGKTPSNTLCVSQFGIGTGSLAPNVSNTDLQSPISFYDPTLQYAGGTLYPAKPITNVTWPSPFIALVQLDLAQAEANGYLITEWGLYASTGDVVTGSRTLLNRKLEAGFQKDSTASPTFSWRVRF